MTAIGLIGGTNADFAFDWQDEFQVETAWGTVALARGVTGGVAGRVAGGREVLFVRRHGARHERLSSQVRHRANVFALKEAGASAIIGTTVCGVVDPAIALGTTIVFNDLLFPDNRLPDGSACTFFDVPGDPRRGHFIFGSPFSPAMRTTLAAAARDARVTLCDRGTYAYMLGPRFNTRAEITWLRSLGVTAVSQTAGPEAVLAGELELPYALVGFGVDYANGVQAEPTPAEMLDAQIAASRFAFEAVVRGALARLEDVSFDTGFVYRFE